MDQKGPPPDVLALLQQLHHHYPSQFKETIKALQRESGASFLLVKQLKNLIMSGKWADAEQYILSFLNAPVQWREKTPIVVALCEIRVQKYKECLERKDDTAALQVLRNDLAFIKAFDDAKRFNTLASLLGYADIREHKRFSSQTEPPSSLRRATYDRVLNFLQQAPELANKIKLKEEKQPQITMPSIPASQFTTAPMQPLLNTTQPHPTIPHPSNPTWPLASSPVSPVASPQVDQTLLQQLSQLHQPQSMVQLSQTQTITPQQQQLLQQIQMQQLQQQNLQLQQALQHAQQTQPVQAQSPAIPAQPAQPAQPLQQSTHQLPQSTQLSQTTVQSQQSQPQEQLKRPADTIADPNRVKRERIDSDVPHPTRTSSPAPAPANGTHNSTESTSNGNSESTIEFPLSYKQSLGIESGQPTAAEFHPITPTLLLVGTTASTVELWDLSTAARRNFFKGVDGKVVALAWTNDGSTFAVAYEYSNKVTTYQLTKHGTIEKCREFVGHKAKVNAIAFSFEDSRGRLVTCSEDCTIKVWNLADGTLEKDLKIHQNPVKSVSVLVTDDQYIIVGTSADGVISFGFFDEREAQLVEGILEPGDWASHTAMIQNHFLTCGREGIVEFDLVEGGKKLIYEDFKRTEGDYPFIHAAGGMYFACYVGDRIHFWKANQSQPDYRLLTGFEVANFALNSHKNLLVVIGKATSELKIYANRKGEELVWQQQQHHIPLKFSSVSVTAAHAPSATPATVRALPQAHKTPVNYIISCEGNTLAAVSYAEASVSITNLGTNITKHNSMKADYSDKNKLVGVSINSKGTSGIFYSATSVDYFEFNFTSGKYKTKKPFFTTKSSNESVAAIAISSSNLLGIASQNNITIVSLKDKKHLMLDNRHTKPLHILAFSDNLLISAGEDYKLCFWESDSTALGYKFKSELQLRGPKPNSSQFAPTGSRHFLLCQNDCVSVYDTKEKVKLGRYIIQNMSVEGVFVNACFSMTAKYVYCAKDNGIIFIFAGNSLNMVQSLNCEGTPTYVAASTARESEFYVATTSGLIYSFSPSDPTSDSWHV